MLIGPQSWTIASAANRGLGAVAQVEERGREWIGQVLSRMRRCQTPVALCERQRDVAPKQNSLRDNEHRFLMVT